MRRTQRYGLAFGKVETKITGAGDRTKRIIGDEILTKWNKRQKMKRKKNSQRHKSQKLVP